MKRPEGIADLSPNEPLGAAISLGVRKESGGYPIDKEFFHIVVPRSRDGIRPHHPLFDFFNNADKGMEEAIKRGTHQSRRKTLKGNILHRERPQCFEHRLTMHAFPKSAPAPRAHPHMRPVCEGDGTHAIRWMQDEAGQEFSNIRCPNERCEYRLTEPAACKPFMRLLFRLRWAKPDLPTPLVKLTSRSWESTANILGLFTMLEAAAKELGIQQPTLYGFPFTLTLIERTKPAKRARYPVITVSPDQDPVDFFLAQKRKLAELPAPALALPDMQDDEQVYEDIQSVSVGND